ncbi:hypothetical protein [Aminivibrio sp.]|jgi:hypothetical protein|uniref:hypothetical protein n=1 Tax=Aminivibrio sp. TaxID=1872489 RepID=UPI001A56F9B0|nr:hypothetical protein [Aminivibrio sp.]MBL3538440.1 hypothetical protein [Aminivibrio sp.]MDK2958360.1 hypothetical protein [Synergistaceae bacterium]
MGEGKTMRRAVAFLGALALAAMLFTLAGSVPEGKKLPSAIPPPGEGVPFLFIEARGDVFASVPSASLPGESGKNAPVLRGLRSLFPLLAEAEEVAVLFSLERGRILTDGVLRFSGDESESIARGTVPESWGTSLEAEKVPGEGLFELKGGPTPLFPLYFRGWNGLTLVGTTPDRVNAMIALLEKGTGGMNISWSVEKRWPNHFLFFDGGLFSHFASQEGISVEPGGISVTAAWRGDRSGGRLKWEADGLEALFRRGEPKKIAPVMWDDRFLAPEPFIASFGISLPEIPPSLFRRAGAGEWSLQDTVGIGGKELNEFLPGPVMVSLGGTGKLLVFSLPGILFQLPDRGTAGTAFARSFWSREWTSLVPAVEKLEGFPEGGTASIPFSIVCAANSEMLRIGVIDGESLKSERKKKITDFVPLMREGKRAVFWAFLDGPAFAEAIRSLARTGKIVERMGRTIGVNMKMVVRASEILENSGVLTVVMPSLGEGVLEWTKPPSPAKGK